MILNKLALWSEGLSTRLCLSGLFVCILIIAGWAGNADSEIVRARVFELTDKAGNRVARLESSPEGFVGLSLGSDPISVAWIRASRDGSLEAQLNDQHARVHARMSLGADSSVTFELATKDMRHFSQLGLAADGKSFLLGDFMHAAPK